MKRIKKIFHQCRLSFQLAAFSEFLVDLWSENSVLSLVRTFCSLPYIVLVFGYAHVFGSLEKILAEMTERHNSFSFGKAIINTNFWT